ALHALVAVYRRNHDPEAMSGALKWFESRLGPEAVDKTLLTFVEKFPPASVYWGEQAAEHWLAGETGGLTHRAVAMEELLMLWLANANPAFSPYSELFDQTLLGSTAYREIASGMRDYFETRPRFGRRKQNLLDVLRAPALTSPNSLTGQLAFLREEFSEELADFLQHILTALDVLKEEEIAIWALFHPPGEHRHFGGGLTAGDSSRAAVLQFVGKEPEYERFSPDVDWMPSTVMLAKTVYVWLDQLSKAHHRHIHTLDQVPDEELNIMARRGVNALWLIGIWERSTASRRIKQLTGNPEAAASAYSLADYRIADDLGGESSYRNLRDRAQLRGIRLASDMVPNHMGIDSRWLIDHPDWFISLPHSPFPSYSFNGPDLSHDGRVEIKVEDHYYDRTDAAVVFRRVDRWSGDTRYVYHGNDGTSFPWNDTAQLDYLNPAVREAVIQTIIHVARLFPIIRFDAAMTLTKQHYQRLWFPAPGTGGAIPSRAEHGLTKLQFDAAMPNEFWREVVDRIAVEVPGTLLLAEAFWLLEGYFVRTLGMHRVYNSAFMNMMRDEENANYRSVLKNTLEFDPEVMKRYVNFMNNPDERTAVDQFGKGDKYFGVCTLLATLPGLPMFGHGQFEGLAERYGMEYRRAYRDEQPDSWLLARHEREISPLLHRRPLFAEVQNFLLYDFFTDSGSVNEDVFAYSNRLGNERALIVYHNRYASTSGWVRMSASYAEKLPDGGKRTRQRSLGESFCLEGDAAQFVAYRDSLSGLEYVHRASEVLEKGLRLELGAYQCHVLLGWRDLREDATHAWGALCESLNGQGVPSLDDAMRALELKPLHEAWMQIFDPKLF
ncbi:MAG TPA: alpha-amylase family glycosyl hydrolase, partial [Terriglobales bacterium]|nr:alpha-amylase family glycosyl hydrolase [Terriglobales bacterium]